MSHQELLLPLLATDDRVILPHMAVPVAIESDAARAATDLLRGGFRAGRVPSGHDDVAAVVGVRLRELAAESLRAADDDDGTRCHLDGCRRLGCPVREQPALAEDVIPRLVELLEGLDEIGVDELSIAFHCTPGDEHRVDVRCVGEDDDRSDRIDHRCRVDRVDL